MRVGISDHALLRWLERRHGIDMEFMRRALAAEVGHILDAGASAAIVDGFQYIVEDGMLVTVIEAHSSLGRDRARHKRMSREYGGITRRREVAR